MAKDADNGGMLTVLGLMSGTSMDGIDAALLRADGERQAQPLRYWREPWDDEMRSLLRQAMQEAPSISRREERTPAMRRAEDAVTRAHAAFVRRIMAQVEHDIDLVGFHGQTVLHAPHRGLTVQLGDGQLLADLVGLPVAWDMRAQDMAHGGQGAPLAPAWHMQLARRLPMRPVMFVNIGGIANITWIGNEDDMPHAFDTGPGNALMDDLVQARCSLPHDEDGALAARGQVDEAALHALLAHPALQTPPPRSFDRHTFDAQPVRHLSTEDALATLCRFTARSIAAATQWLPAAPELWIICGGGRHNRTLMAMLAEEVAAPVVPSEAVEMHGDYTEAEAWAWLAVRALKGLPLTWPTTTGVRRPVSGGIVSWPSGGSR